MPLLCALKTLDQHPPQAVQADKHGLDTTTTEHWHTHGTEGQIHTLVPTAHLLQTSYQQERDPSKQQRGAVQRVKQSKQQHTGNTTWRGDSRLQVEWTSWACELHRIHSLLAILLLLARPAGTPVSCSNSVFMPCLAVRRCARGISRSGEGCRKALVRSSADTYCTSSMQNSVSKAPPTTLHSRSDLPCAAGDTVRCMGRLYPAYGLYKGRVATNTLDVLTDGPMCYLYSLSNIPLAATFLFAIVGWWCAFIGQIVYEHRYSQANGRGSAVGVSWFCESCQLHIPLAFTVLRLTGLLRSM